jgi:soluble lytic murein transglycosylase-like protein
LRYRDSDDLTVAAEISTQGDTVSRMKARWRTRVVATALLACAGACAMRAAELSALHITLSNGFDLICDHREDVGDRVRLYLEPGSQSFVEVANAEIVAVEPAPAMKSKSVAAPDVTPSAASLSPTPEELRGMMSRAGAQHNLDVDLLASVIRAESGGNPHAVSRTGAQGLMQLMPATAAQLGVADSFHPEQNINGGTAYLDALLTRYHDNVSLALAAYNAGPAAVDKYHGIPPYRETRAYVSRVIHEFNRRKSQAAREPGKTLQASRSAAQAGNANASQIPQ